MHHHRTRSGGSNRSRTSSIAFFDEPRLLSASRLGALSLVVYGPLTMGVFEEQPLNLLLFRILLVATSLLLAVGLRRDHVRLLGDFSWYGWVLLGATVVGMAQLAPLPQSIARLLAPHTQALREEALQGLVPAAEQWNSISGDLAGGLHGVGWWATALLFFILGRRLFPGRSRIRLLLAVIAGTGTAVILIGVAHHLAGARLLYGFIPGYYEQRPFTFTSTLFNANHLASYLGMTTLAFLGLTFMDVSTKKSRRPLWIAMAGVAAFFSVAANSRGGLGALIVCLLISFVYLLRGDHRQSRRALLILLPLTAGAALLWYGAPVILPSLTGLLGDAPLPDRLGKLAVLVKAFPLFLAHPFLGIGMGTFPFLFFQHMGTSGQYMRYLSPENLPYQWMIELGWPLGLLLFGGLVWLVVVTLVRDEHRWSSVGALIMLFVLLHNLLDHNLSLGAVQAPFFLIAGALSATVWRRRIEDKPAGLPAAISLWIAGGAVAAALIGSTVLGNHWFMERDWRRVHALAHGGSDGATFLAGLRPILNRRPLDGYLFEQAAVFYKERNRKKDLKRRELLQTRALRLRPAHPRTQYRLALTYLEQKRTTLAIPLLASAFDTSFRIEDGQRLQTTMRERILRRSDLTVAELWSIFPKRPEFIRALFTYEMKRGDMEAASWVIAKARSLFGDTAMALQMEGRLAEQRRDWEATDRLYAKAVRKCRDEMAAHPRKGAPVFTDNPAEIFAARADFLKRRQRFEEATPLLREAIQIQPTNGDYWFLYLDTLLAQRRFREAQTEIERFQRVTGMKDRFLYYSGLLAHAEGDHADAVKRFQLALDYLKGHGKEKGRVEVYAALTRVLLDLRRYADADQNLGALRKINPSYYAIPALEKRLKAAVEGRSDPPESGPEPTDLPPGPPQTPDLPAPTQ